MAEAKYYKSKAIPLKRAIGTGQLLVNRGITKYFILPNHQAFIDLIGSSVVKDFYEYIPAQVQVPFFFDIEIYRGNSEYFENPKLVIDACVNHVRNLFVNTHNHPQYGFKTIILESNSESKRSYHVIIRVTDEQDQEILFANVGQLKDLYKSFGLDAYRDTNNKNLVDPSVYREGLFRTIYSSKTGEVRPLVKCDWSDPFTDIETLITWHSDSHIIYKQPELPPEIAVIEPEEIIVNVPEELSTNDIQTIKRFVQREFHHYPNRIRDVFIDKQYNCIIVALNERYCPIADREHRGNNQYIVIDTTSAKQKCHDTECNSEKYMEITLDKFPIEVNEVIKKCLKVNQQELTLIDNAIVECRNYINENFDQQVTDVSFDRNAMIFRGSVADRNLARILKGKCPECHVEHQISDTGYCLKCTKCLSIFPKNQIIPVDGRYKALNSFWMNYNQLVNNGTINNIINIYNGGDIEFSCDIKLDNSIFKNKEVTGIVNQVLDGHKVTMISKLLNIINNNFMYSRNNWYYFTGAIWKSDSDNIEMKKEIMDLSKLFERIKRHYDTKQNDESTMSLSKNIKSLINKFHKPGFQDDVIKGAKIYYNDEGFISNLNSKKHLVPFSNGVYDLLENKFRSTKKEDYINLTMNYDYDAGANNPEVYTFLEQVLPNKGVRDYVLKKMSDCLNGDIPNTNFMMFIGDTGANGKSQLLNLMKLTMGDFGEKVEVTLLTRRRNNANEANTEKIKLMYKRFAFLSEPEDGEKINIGLLKELTGSEEIVARGLYQEAVSFVMEAKLFLACNELPEIKGEDTALWRRIRVIDFPSRFVDEPKESNEYKIDRTLPSRMREDGTWRQTFMKILLEYSYKDVKEPIEVKMKTNEYQSENDLNSVFVMQNLIKGGEFVKWTELYDRYKLWYEQETEKKFTGKRKKVKEYFEKKVFKREEMPVNSLRGWSGWSLTPELD